MKGDVLYLIDLQNDFIDGVLGTQEAQRIIPKITNFIDKFDGTIVITKDTHTNHILGDSEKTIEEKLFPSHCIDSSYGNELHSEVAKSLKDKEIFCYLLKRTFGCLKIGDDLDIGYDFDKLVNNIYICGLVTDICVLNNAIILRNKLPKHNIIVLSDLCAGTTPENHQKALDIMKVNCIEVKTSEEIK